jgi:hypothetical protein
MNKKPKGRIHYEEKFGAKLEEAVTKKASLYTGEDKGHSG